MRRGSDALLQLFEAASDWDDWAGVAVGKGGKVKKIPKGRTPSKPSGVILTDSKGEASFRRD